MDIQLHQWIGLILFFILTIAFFKKKGAGWKMLIGGLILTLLTINPFHEDPDYAKKLLHQYQNPPQQEAQPVGK